MKILAVHNFHRSGSASGDDQVFKSETTLLEKRGHDVVRYTVSNDNFDKAGVFGKLTATAGMLWSFKNYKAISEIIKREKPDIMHVHTFFPLLSPSILYAAKRHGEEWLPLFMTLGLFVLSQLRYVKATSVMIVVMDIICAWLSMLVLKDHEHKA